MAAVARPASPDHLPSPRLVWQLRAVGWPASRGAEPRIYVMERLSRTRDAGSLEMDRVGARFVALDHGLAVDTRPRRPAAPAPGASCVASGVLPGGSFQRCLWRCLRRDQTHVPVQSAARYVPVLRCIRRRARPPHWPHLTRLALIQTLVLPDIVSRQGRSGAGCNAMLAHAESRHDVPGDLVVAALNRTGALAGHVNAGTQQLGISRAIVAVRTGPIRGTPVAVQAQEAVVADGSDWTPADRARRNRRRRSGCRSP